MKITEKQLLFLYQIAMDSVEMDIMGIFSYPIDQRVDAVNVIMKQQEGETLIDISDDKPTLEPQFYKEDKKIEVSQCPSLQEAVSLLGEKVHQGEPASLC